MKKGICRIMIVIMLMLWCCSSVWAGENHQVDFSDGETGTVFSERDLLIAEEEFEGYTDSGSLFQSESEENTEEDSFFQSGPEEYTETDSLFQSEQEEYTETVPLLQNGDMISQYFKGASVYIYSSEEDWKDVFRARVSYAMQNCEEYLYVDDLLINKETDINNVRLIYRSCIKGDRYYISGNFSYYCNSEMNITKIKIGYYSAYCDSDGRPDKNKITESLSAFNIHANQAISYAANGRNELEQMLLAHDWIVRECDYDYTSVSAGAVPNVSYNAYGCLVEGSAVCNGYALAYSYILGELGYESYIIASDAMNHAWNMINIDSNWFHVDTTWDDPVFLNGTTFHNFNNNDYSDEGFVSHTYFLKNDSEMESMKHYDWRLQNSELTLPVSAAQGLFDGALFREANSTEYNLVNNHWYYVQDGKLCKADDLWGTNRAFLSEEEVLIDYVHSLNGLLYFTDFNSIYCWNPDTETCLQVFHSEDTISELTVKKRKLIYVSLSGDNFQRCISNYEPGISAPKETRILSIIPYTDRMKICWEKTENIDGYVLYYSDKTDGNFKVLKKVDSNVLTTYSHRFDIKTTYYYKIRTFTNYNGQKIYSDYSDIAVGKQIPSQVTGIKAYYQEPDYLYLFWDLCEGADGYVIYESQDGGQTWKTIKTINTETGFYKKKEVASTSLFRIRSFVELDGKKIMGAIPDQNCEIEYLLSPDEFSAVKITGQKIKLKWNPVDLADGYVIYRSTNGDTYKVIKTIKYNSVTSYINTIETGTNNTYRIRVYKNVQNRKLYGSILEVS